MTGLLDKFIEDKDQKAALAHEIATMSEKHAGFALAQTDVNKAEAASGSIFAAGWRNLRSAGFALWLSLTILFCSRFLCSCWCRSTLPGCILCRLAVV